MLVLRRVDELVAYQDRRYAQRYVSVLERVQRARGRPGAGGPVTAAVAANLYKLMAYKDEYEVARLSLDPALERRISEQFGDGARTPTACTRRCCVPPGMDRKISLGRWFRPGFRTLYAMRRLRGTRLDPFGRGEVRATERALIQEYVASIDDALTVLTPETVVRVVELAELADVVRGYEHVKMGNVARFRARLAEVRESLGL